MLYVVGTPIGNLQDLSLRQTNILVSSDIILTEDTRSAQIILEFIRKNFSFKINPNLRLISYYKEKEFEKLSDIINLLKENLTISLISESGLPVISDPGYLLIKTVIKQNIPFVVIPGPSSITAGIIYSGFNIKDGFMFLGFLPKKQSELTHLINRMMQIKKILNEICFVCFESPNRINKTLKIFDKLYSNCDITICREMTKKFEEIIRGKPSELLNRRYKGEITLIIK